MALGAPEETGAELALLTTGVPPTPTADAAVDASPTSPLADTFSGSKLAELLDTERATALLAMHAAEAAAHEAAVAAAAE